MMEINGGLAQWDWQLKRYYAEMFDGRRLYANTIEEFMTLIGGLTEQQLADLQLMREVAGD